MLSHSSPTSDKVGDGGAQSTLLPKKPLAFLHIRSENNPAFTQWKNVSLKHREIADLDHKQDSFNSNSPLPAVWQTTGLQ